MPSVTPRFSLSSNLESQASPELFESNSSADSRLDRAILDRRSTQSRKRRKKTKSKSKRISSRSRKKLLKTKTRNRIRTAAKTWTPGSSTRMEPSPIRTLDPFPILTIRSKLPGTKNGATRHGSIVTFVSGLAPAITGPTSPTTSVLPVITIPPSPSSIVSLPVPLATTTSSDSTRNSITKLPTTSSILLIPTSRPKITMITLGNDSVPYTTHRVGSRATTTSISGPFSGRAQSTSLFNSKPWIIVVIALGITILMIITILLCLRGRRNRRQPHKPLIFGRRLRQHSDRGPILSMEISEPSFPSSPITPIPDAHTGQRDHFAPLLHAGHTNSSRPPLSAQSERLLIAPWEAEEIAPPTPVIDERLLVAPWEAEDMRPVNGRVAQGLSFVPSPRAGVGVRRKVPPANSAEVARARPTGVAVKSRKSMDELIQRYVMYDDGDHSGGEMEDRDDVRTESQGNGAVTGDPFSNAGSSARASTSVNPVLGNGRIGADQGYERGFYPHEAVKTSYERVTEVGQPGILGSSQSSSNGSDPIVIVGNATLPVPTARFLRPPLNHSNTSSTGQLNALESTAARLYPTMLSIPRRQKHESVTMSLATESSSVASTVLEVGVARRPSNPSPPHSESSKVELEWSRDYEEGSGRQRGGIVIGSTGDIVDEWGGRIMRSLEWGSRGSSWGRSEWYSGSRSGRGSQIRKSPC
ncbi:hypothetical protein BJ742DRAFT_843707 [Cladochytrium replicatum]|nr:hypothetical protein BJ742DRAFT_843707 [Cladochytrium replicatum]